ncbi:hypothetical protein C0991_002822 [Blastosporella zonata]|nr:hypothetical protein C0991_002822 [Blastosporella zonata]
MVHLESLRMTVTVAAHLGLHMWQVDFVSTFLNSELTHTVYMRVPPGFWGGEGKEEAEVAKRELMDRFEAKDLGEPEHLLGMRIKCNEATQSVHLSQCTYLKRILK